MSMEEWTRENGLSEKGPWGIEIVAVKPSEIFVLFEWDNLQTSTHFARSEKLSKVMKEAGVIGKPDLFPRRSRGIPRMRNVR